MILELGVRVYIGVGISTPSRLRDSGVTVRAPLSLGDGTGDTGEGTEKSDTDPPIMFTLWAPRVWFGTKQCD